MDPGSLRRHVVALQLFVCDLALFCVMKRCELQEDREQKLFKIGKVPDLNHFPC